MQIRSIALGAVALLGLVACDARRDLEDPPVDLGPFKLGYNIVTAPEPAIAPGSLTVTEAEWQEALTGAIDERFGRYEGDRLYHFGVNVNGYLVTRLDAGVPGVPSLKSVLLVQANIWDDAKGVKLNDEPYVISVVSAFSGDGPFPSKEAIVSTLSARVAKGIEQWLLTQPDWFDEPGTGASQITVPDLKGDATPVETTAETG